MKYAIAVLDVGMTNKKVVIYDDRFRQLECVLKSFPVRPVPGHSGVEAHDLDGIFDWFLDTLKDFARKFPIGVISVTAHGATFVCTDGKGLPCVPCVAYTFEPGDEFHSRFYRLAGNPDALQRSTGTASLKALINVAQGVMFAKEEFPREFADVRSIQMYPQYYGFRLTGRYGADPTYTGCHTYLWDFERNGWSGVADALGIRRLLPKGLEPSWARLGTLQPEIAARTGLPAATPVTMGIHDSNASLLPYLAKQSGREFVLDSTGTWCVTMHPQDEYEFLEDDIGKVVFFNRAATLKPVKTAIFLGGLEFDEWRGVILGPDGKVPPFDPETYRRVIGDRAAFILPEMVPGSGQFPGSVSRAVELSSKPDGTVSVGERREYPFAGLKAGGKRPSFMKDPAYATAVLNLSLALQTEVAVARAGLAPGADLFIEGGFRKNPDYAAMLTALLPRSSVCFTDIAEATSFGAAMIGRMAVEGIGLEALASDVRLERTPAPGFTADGLQEYRALWRSFAGGSPV